MTTKHKTTQEPPVVLPVGFNAWLLDCVPVADCGVCAANWRQLNNSKKVGDIAQAARHADEIRSHPSGAH
ncbi:hypothetical protein OG317_37065 [Streptomyces sp. NBC_01167]|uniref:hypothetical protein n=1 Tax=Streptomyces sp. NBC_01167 TaxID=2903756 RepID=UPI003869A2D3|nr:hypothetical protein OG317_37065 [Streptomyces sp. NBC_01167]